MDIWTATPVPRRTDTRIDRQPLGGALYFATPSPVSGPAGRVAANRPRARICDGETESQGEGDVLKCCRQAGRGLAAAGLLGLLVVSCYGLQQAHSWYQTEQAVADVQTAAQQLLAAANDSQRAQLVVDYDQPARLDWHFIPKDSRKGWKLGDMSDQQRELADQLLQGLLSQIGYQKSTQIMNLERLLLAVEQGRGPLRDPLRYYVTFFDPPSENGRWGVSFEGHHLSLNFVLQGGRVISSSPQMMGSNPAVVKQATAGIAAGTRVLAEEETLAFELVQSLTAEQLKVAQIAAEALREIRAAGEPQPPAEPPAGIPFTQLTDQQQQRLLALIVEYIDAMPPAVASARREDLKQGGSDAIHFAWAGATEPGVGHYYRVQGPSFLIEFVNTQPDAMGNPANHIHCAWRDMRGDFALARP